MEIFRNFRNFRNFLGLFGNTLRLGACIVSNQVYYFLCFIYLFLVRGVSIHILDFVNINLINEFIMVSWGRRRGVRFWYSCMLMTCNFINNEILCAFTVLLSVGECISSKNNG